MTSAALGALLAAVLPAQLFDEAKCVGRAYEPGSEVKYVAYRMAGAPATNAPVYALLEFSAKEMGPMFDGFAADGLMPPGLVVCISPGFLPPEVSEGRRWYLRAEEFDQPNREYADFVTRELLPAAAVRAGVTLSADPNLHFVAGGSSGGAAAWHLVWYGRDYFRRAYLASPTFSDVRGAQIMPFLVRKTEAKPVRVFITMGDVEPDRHPGDSFAVGFAARSSLDYAGYPCLLEYFPAGGHLSGKASPATMRRMISFTWANWQTQPVVATGNPPRVNEVIAKGTAWEPYQGTFPAKEPVRGFGGTYEAEGGSIVFVSDAGARKTVYSGGVRITGLSRAHDAGRLYATDAGRRFVLSFALRRDGTLGPACRHAPITLPVDPTILGANDLCYFPNCQRLLAATELGVTGFHHMGAEDVILPLPDDLPATRVAVKDGWLYAASGERVWRRKTNPEETPQDTTAYLSKGEHRYTAHLPFFKAATGKKSVLLPNFFYTEEGLKGQPPIPTGDAAAQAAANGDF